MRHGLTATRNKSPRTLSQPSGPFPLPFSPLEASSDPSLLDSLSTDLEGISTNHKVAGIKT